MRFTESWKTHRETWKFDMIGWIAFSTLYIIGSIGSLGFFATHVENQKARSKSVGLALLWVLFWPVLTIIFMALVLRELFRKK